MSLLHQDSPEELDDAALGEELTKGTSHVVWASIIATVLVSAAIAWYFIAGQKPPVVKGEIVAVWAVPRHTETSGFDASGASIPKESSDQVLVFVQARLQNVSPQPLFLYNLIANVTLADGIHSSYAVTATDYQRVFLAYPGIPVPHGTPLPLETTIEPGKTVEGSNVAAFRITKAEWDARKKLNFTFSFRYQPNLVLTPSVAVTEQ